MNAKRAILSISLAAILALLGPLGYQIHPGSNAFAASNTLVGFWTVTVTAEGKPPFTHAMIFSSDGTMTAMEYNGRPGIGAWEKVAPRSFAYPVIQGGQLTWKTVWESTSTSSYAVPKIQGGQVTWSKEAVTIPVNSFIFTFWEFFEAGRSLSKAKVSGTVQLSQDGEHYNGPVSVEIYGPNGKLLSSDGGTATGVRQHVEASH